MSEIGASLFTILEIHFSTALDGNGLLGNDNIIQEQHKVLCERLQSTIKSLVSSEVLSLQDENEMNPICRCEHKVAAWSQLSRYHSFVMILIAAMLLGCFIFFYCTCFL